MTEKRSESHPIEFKKVILQTKKTQLNFGLKNKRQKANQTIWSVNSLNMF